MNCTAPLSRCHLAALAALALTLAGCTVIRSRSMSTSTVPQAGLAGPKPVLTRGIPYFLPTSVVDLTFESLKDDKAKHKEFAVTTATRIVPDPKARYLLNSPDAFHVSKKHHFKFKDGLLSAVETEDEDKLLDMVVDLAATAVNVLGFQAAGGMPHAAGADPRHDPSPAELAEIYSMIPAGTHTISLPRGKGNSTNVPGTNGLLQLSTRTTDSFGAQALPETPSSLKQHSAPDAGFAGIHARILKPVTFEMAMLVPRPALKEWRVVRVGRDLKLNAAAQAAKRTEQVPKAKAVDEARQEADRLSAETTSLEKSRDELTAARDRAEPGSAAQLALTQQISSLLADLTRIREQHATARSKLDGLVEELDSLGEDLQKLVAAADGDDGDESVLSDKDGLKAQSRYWNKWAPGGDYAAMRREGVLLIPDESITVEVPVTRNVFGLSKSSLTLESGILTAYHVDKAAPGTAVVKTLYSVSEKLVELPAKLLQLKIDHSTKEKSLIEAQQARDKLVADIAKAKLDPEPKSAHEQEVGRLRQEKEIAELQKDIAKLRADIAEAAGAAAGQP